MIQQLRHTPQRSHGDPNTRRPRVEIVQRWVETADERCPLACTWSALPELIADADIEPISIQPAFGFFSPKAGYLHHIHILPALSIPLPHIV